MAKTAATVLMLIVLSGPRTAAQQTVSPWVSGMKPAIHQFAYDAEAGLLCGRFGEEVDKNAIGFGFDHVGRDGLSPTDSGFVQDVLTDGQADAIIDIHHGRAAVCDKLTLSRLKAVGTHFATQVPKWPERR